MGIAIKNSKWVFITISHRDSTTTSNNSLGSIITNSQKAFTTTSNRDFTTTNNKVFIMTSRSGSKGASQERVWRGMEEGQIRVKSDGRRHRPSVKTAHGALCGEQARTGPAREPRHRTGCRRTHVLRGGRNLHEREQPRP